MGFWGSVITVASGIVAILTGFVLLIGWLYRKIFPPKLELIERFYSDKRLIAGILKISIQNTGKAPAKEVSIDLYIKKPCDIEPGYGIFFNQDNGTLKSESTDLPGTYHYVMGVDVKIRPYQPPKEIVSFIVYAVDDTLPESLDYNIDWEVYHDDKKVKGEFKKSGEELKRILLTNLYESGHVIGYEIPCGKLPKIPENE